MPKLLPNLRDELLQQAAQILREEGYAALSIRSLAMRCNVATGTIYNYFSSKDALIAQIMMADWRITIGHMDAIAAEADTPTNGMLAMYHALERFVTAHRMTWLQFAQNGGSSSPMLAHHAELRSQLTAPIALLIQRTGDVSLLPLAPLLAETLLSCAVQPDLDEQPLHLLMQRLSPAPNDQQHQEE